MTLGEDTTFAYNRIEIFIAIIIGIPDGHYPVP